MSGISGAIYCSVGIYVLDSLQLKSVQGLICLLYLISIIIIKLFYLNYILVNLTLIIFNFLSVSFYKQHMLYVSLFYQAIRAINIYVSDGMYGCSLGIKK